MQILNHRLLDLINKLDELGSEPSLAALAHAMKQVQLTPEDVAAYVQPNLRNYNRASVVLRQSYELLVMTWLPGQSSVPHDHSGSICIMQVVQGEAIEGCYQIAADGFADLQYETKAPRGQVMAGQDAGVHIVRNSQWADDTLVTVHVYAPPLKDFRQFTPRLESSEPRYRIVPNRTPTVVIVGGGFSGAMTAAQILRRAVRAGVTLKVVLFERRGTVGEGIAYSTRESCHLLNVPAGRMSAWPDRPDDFVQWVSGRYGPVKPQDFLPRPWYGEYVRESLLATARDLEGQGNLDVVFDEVRRIARHPSGGWMVHLGRERSLRADGVVLAVGHRPPSDPIGRHWTGSRARFIADPWRPFAMNVVGSDEPVVILGSGLTAVDTVLSLAQQPRRTPITLVSPHGLVPQAHALTPASPVDMSSFVSEQLDSSGNARSRTLLHNLRRKVRELALSGVDWRRVVDGLRPHTARLWQSMLPGERRRFLTRIRPYWEVHRHRMALAVTEPFRALLDRGVVRLVAGRIVSAQANDQGVRLIVRQRGTDRLFESQAAWVINCTGPMPSNSVESNPVIGSLLVYGWLRPDELALGIETTLNGNSIAADGSVVSDLFIVGTLRKPALWESTAVPELRTQTSSVADGVISLLIQQYPQFAGAYQESPGKAISSQAAA